MLQKLNDQMTLSQEKKDILLEYETRLVEYKEHMREKIEHD